MSEIPHRFDRSDPRAAPVRPELRLVRAEPLSRLADLDLVSLAQDRSTLPTAAPEVLRRYHPLVLRILRRSLGPEGDVADLAQEVFLRLFARLHTLRDGQALKAFVIAVAVNVLKWELRRRELRRIVGLDRDVDRFAESGIAGAPDEDAREAFARFRRIVTALKPRDRVLFSLRFFEEMTVDEVAAATGIPPRTCKRHLARIWARVVALASRDDALAAYVNRWEARVAAGREGSE